MAATPETEKNARKGLYLGASDGESGRNSNSKGRRSGGQDETDNGGEVEEHDGDKCCGGSRWRRKPLGWLLRWGERGEVNWSEAEQAGRG
jgi:hypothetical protein